MRRVLRPWMLLAVVVGVIGLPAIVGRTDEPQKRPAAWATPLERPGLPNLNQVNDGLYRGAQPTAEGIKELEKLGVRTIIGLRSKHTDKDLLGDSKIVFEHIPMTPQNPKEKDVVRFLRIVTDKKRQPAFVHCQHGADRTGAMCAAYRVVVEGWTKQAAIEEMTKGGYEFHAVWVNLPKFIKNLDVEKIKKEIRPKKTKEKESHPKETK
jgi:tyrosine-protein phosphatase SIW14